MKQRYYLLDTNILGPLAELKTGGSSPECKALEKHWSSLPPDTKIYLCPITAGEVEYGLRVGPYDKPEQLELVRNILSSFDFYDIDVNLARDQYADLRARLFNRCAPKDKRNRKKHKKRIEEWRDPTTSKLLQIQENDLWIASVAMAYNLILVTRDKMNAIKDIAGSDLQFENWLT
jgi:predicted nucleic acid-binding protein